jgi:hypothetical protein
MVEARNKESPGRAGIVRDFQSRSWSGMYKMKIVLIASN